MHIRPFLPADHHDIAAFSVTATWGDSFLDGAFPDRKQYPTHMEAFFVRRLKAHECKAGIVTLVAETDPGDVGPNGEGICEGGRVVGRMTLQRLGRGVVAERWRAVRPARTVEAMFLAVEEWYVKAFGLNKAVDALALQRHEARLMAVTPKPLAEERFAEMWEVVNLVVDEKFQKRRVGKMLMEWVMRQALSEGVPVGLRSSVAGKRLYEGLGFENLGDFGWEINGQGVKQTWMAWFPQGKD